MKILVHIDDAATWQQALASRFPEAEVITGDAPEAHRQGADYLAVWKPPSQLLQEQTRLRGIINLGAGVDALLRTPGLPTDVPIVKLRDAGMSELMADYVLYGVLHFQRHFDRYALQQRNAEWRDIAVRDKADWAVGVLGLGAIGRAVAIRLRQAGFQVHGWSRGPRQMENIVCHHGEAGLDELLGRVDTLVTLLPDTEQTRGLINAERLARLPAGASLINPGRGALVDESALLEALGSGDEPGHLRGALLDVFHQEPLPQESPLWTHPRVWITPHMAAPTPLREAIDQVEELIRAFEKGETLETVDPAAGY